MIHMHTVRIKTSLPVIGSAHINKLKDTYETIKVTKWVAILLGGDKTWSSAVLTET